MSSFPGPPQPQPPGPAPGPPAELDPLRELVREQFVAAFGKTELRHRVEDVFTQATSLARYTDLDNLKDEAGDLLASVLQLCNERDWDPAELVRSTLAKINSRSEQYCLLGRKLRVGLLGGAFDPVHNGHVEVAREVLRLGGLDEVWLTPCFEHPSGRALAPAEDRLEMCRLAVRGQDGVGVFDYEIRHQFRGETYHLVKRLLAEEVARIRCDFTWILGQDNADGFDSWAQADELERLIRFLVVPRPGWPPPGPSAWYLRPPHAYLGRAKLEAPATSAEVRRLLREGGPAAAAHLLPPGVPDYLLARGLYRPDPVPAAPVPVRRLALFTSSFDPPSRYHQQVAAELLGRGFQEVIICPQGRKPGQPGTEHAAPIHRAHLTAMTFRSRPGVTVDLSDLDDGSGCAPGEIAQRHAARGEVWHVVAADFVRGGGASRSVIHTQWDDGPDLWARAPFVILHPPGAAPAPEDLPPRHLLVPAGEHIPTAELRTRIFRGQRVDYLLPPEVAAYIQRHGLFGATLPGRVSRLRIDQPRLMIVADERNPRSRELAALYRPFEHADPNLILVLGGDGTMLHAIREHWRLRVPFFGINTGHLGFLLNERSPESLAGAEMVLYHLPMLRVETRTPDHVTHRGVAFNDAWVERESGQAAWLRLDVDGQERVDRIVGDGVLVSTPSGSSAYARAMGAMPVPLGSPILTLAGSNIFSPRFWQPIALPDSSVVTLTSLDDSGKRPVRAFLGGWPVGRVQSIEVRLSSVAAVELAFNPEFDPSSRLLRSLFPPAE